MVLNKSNFATVDVDITVGALYVLSSDVNENVATSITF